MGGHWLWVAVLASILVIVVFTFLPTRRDETSDELSVQIVVLGDIGRSPRMQYHAASVLKHKGHVQMVGYLGI
jgi:beta-1,4-mannosyltransferase